MVKRTVKLETIEKVKNFIPVVTKFEVDMDLVSDRYMVDAKSIMGIFSMNLSKPLELRIYCDDNASFLPEIDEKLAPFIE